MGIAKKFVITSVLVAVGLYWLTAPIPSGYSLQSSLGIGKINAIMKVFQVLVCVKGFFGNDTYESIARSERARQSSKHLQRKDPNLLVETAVFDNVRVLVYRPVNAKGLLPAVVFYHGGGWVLGSPEEHHPLVSHLSKTTNAVFVSVDYRLAPEHIFPAGFEDCLTATKHFILNSDKYNVDPQHIAIGVLCAGDSAGGNLAAAVALKLRDEKFQPKVKMQILIYPVVQSLDYQLPSMLHQHPLLSRDRMGYFASMYLNGTAEHYMSLLDGSMVPAAVRKQLHATHLNVEKLPKKYLVGYTRPNVNVVDEKLWNEIKDTMLNPYFNPLFADDLGLLPMTYVFTCEHDILRDEGILYVERLKAAGNDVTHVHSDIGFHGVLSLGLTWPEFHDALSQGIIWPEVVPMLDRLTSYIVKNL